ncbi:DUF4185 domain-containing protein [Nocardioides lijunqiniae]|uniref:DUF4185 domain-containing protein n=1 Tax=Nocardioides lijunqiniae TaxID=2760832 RepID=UPI00187853C1|nr:DUF4185 domain-containing protein [Nocardioides lijunqiniae]
MSSAVRRPAVLVCLLLLGGGIASLVGLAVHPDTGTPHSVPLVVVAPGVVADALADEANALDDRPFAAVAADEADGEQARDEVADGTVVATLVVDLAGTRDTLVLNAGRDPGLNDAVLDRVRQNEATRDRTVRVERVGQRTGAASHAYDLCLVAAVLGFLAVVVMSARGGPVALTLRRGAGRIVELAALAVVAGPTLAALPWTGVASDHAAVAAVVGLHVLVVAVLTLALESLAGLTGLALAALSFVVLNAPLVARLDPLLLPSPWAAMASWSPSGAAYRAVEALTALDGDQLLRPVLVLLAWLATGLLTLLSARWVRARLRALVASSAAGDAPVRIGDVRVWWSLAVVVPAAALLLSATLLVPESAPPAGALPSRASQTECVATGELEDVADLNRVAGRLRGSPAFQGGDVGADVLLQDGRRLWVFGDTLRDPDFDGQTFVRNSMLVVGPGCLSVVVPPERDAVIPDRTDASAPPGTPPVGYWPMSVGRVERPGYDLVSVATQRVRTVGDGAFDFENLGTSIAVFVVPRGGTPQLVTQRDIGADDADTTRTTWGAAATIVHDGDGPWVYLYGTSRPDTSGAFGFAMRLARVRPDDILDARRWRYWDGAAWAPSERSAATLIPAQGGVSQTLSVFRDRDTWYALSKQDEVLGTNLTVWTAPSPTGPFTPQPPLAQLPSDTVTGLLRYMPLAHPDLLPRPGTMVVSYSRNSTDVGEVVRDPLLYRPRFLRVTLP